MSSRTQPQIAADEQLSAAISAVYAAYHGEGSGDIGVLTEYIVMSAWTTWDDDGDSLTAIVSTPMNGDVPYHRALGLLEYGSCRYRKRIAED